MENINLARPFKDLNIAIAVDTSGSTAGATLKSETQAIRDLANTIKSSTEDSCTVLP